jgi:hypothetical protein
MAVVCVVDGWEEMVQGVIAKGCEDTGEGGNRACWRVDFGTVGGAFELVEAVRRGVERGKSKQPRSLEQESSPKVQRRFVVVSLSIDYQWNTRKPSIRPIKRRESEYTHCNHYDDPHTTPR